MKTITIPGPPRIQQRHRHRKVGHKVITYDPSSGDKKSFLLSILNERPTKPLRGALRVDIDCYFKRPKSHYRTGKFANLLKDDAPQYHTVTPDKDNLEKFPLDAMNKVFWVDDSQICFGDTRKLYAEGDPYTVIKITIL